MPIDPVNIWIDEIAKLKVDSAKDQSWAERLATIVDRRVTSKLQLVKVKGQITFTFQKAIFEAQLRKIFVSKTINLPAEQIAQAWETAVLASRLVVATGSYVGSPTPPTTFSVVASSKLIPASIKAGRAVIVQELLANKPVPNAYQSQLGPALFKGFKLLQATVSGTNSDSTPAPLSVPSTPVI